MTSDVSDDRSIMKLSNFGIHWSFECIDAKKTTSKVYFDKIVFFVCLFKVKGFNKSQEKSIQCIQYDPNHNDHR